MWREFGRERSGFAFELELLREEFDEPDFGLIVVQVDYDAASVARRLRALALKILETSRHYATADRNAADRITERQLWWIGTKAAIQCKGAKHAPDCEWRRVATPRMHGYVGELTPRVERVRGPAAGAGSV